MDTYSEDDMTDIDNTFRKPSNSPFVYTVIDSIPSRPQNPITLLLKKYKSQDSTVLFVRATHTLSSQHH